MPSTVAPDLLRETDVLPERVLEMVRVIGEDATLKLIQEMAGRRLLVPGFPHSRPSTRFKRLEEMVGTKAAQAFAERWGNVEIEVPRCTAVIRLQRDRAIVAAYSAGAQVSDLAKQFGLGERHIFKILKRPISST